MTTNLLRRIDTVLMTAHSPGDASVSSLTFGIYRCICGVVPEDEPGRPLQFVGVVADGVIEPSAIYVRRDV